MEKSETTSIVFPSDQLALGLLKAREARQFTLKHCSQLLGIPTSRLRNYENGRYVPSLPEIEALSFIYGLPLAALFDPRLIEELVRQPQAEKLQQLSIIRRHIIANQLKIAFDQSGKTIKEVAKTSGMAAARVQKYLHDEVDIPLDDLQRLCAALNLELTSFYDTQSSLGRWQALQSRQLRYANLPEDIQEKVVTGGQAAYLRAAQRLMDLNPALLQSLAEALHHIPELQSDEGDSTQSA